MPFPGEYRPIGHAVVLFFFSPLGVPAKALVLVAVLCTSVSNSPCEYLLNFLSFFIL